jgi:hypothetical protein
MSNDKTQNVTEIVPQAETSTEDVVTKPNFLARGKNFVQNHKKPAIAVGALVSLVGIAALAGRKSADYDLNVELEPMARVPEDELDDSTDTETA